MKKRGRSSDQALLRTTVNKKNLTFSQKRLIKDLQEIEEEKIPTVGVTARPLPDNIFVWHANIRGPQNTLYEGAVFHIEMVFPQSYPHHPPNITLFNSIPHPNVFGNYICLDMIDNSRSEEGGGWSSCYSVQSVLTQLQSFLFEENLSENKEKTEMEIKKAVKAANAYKCRKCKHGGKLSCWPVFSLKENDDEQYKIHEEDENTIIKKELICYHTKLHFTDNQLGLGLKISKIPRTGNIREAETFYDYISVKAFLKESINRTASNERLTHWLPVYFGKCDNEEKFFKFLTKGISMIMTNSTRNFKKEFILEVFPKIMITLIYHIMDEKKHASIRQLRILTHMHSMFLFSLKKYPELCAKIEEQIRAFIKDENARIKDNQPNLGAILAMLSAIDTIKFEDVREAYFNEQLDRQVLWILKSVPELLDQTMDEEADQKRAEIVFKSQKTSFQIFCFYKHFITEICERRKSKDQMLDEYESNLCKLTNKEEEEFQKGIFHIQKKINTFEDFFEFTGIQKRSKEEITEMLKIAIKNSERKKYHGELQIVHELPNSSEQFQKILAKIPSYKEFFTVTCEDKKEGNKLTQVYQIKEANSKEEDWKRMCCDRWAWIKEALVYERDLTSQQLSAKALDYSKEGIFKPEDRLLKIIKTKYLSKQIDHRKPEVKVPQISWKQLFLRLDLEDFLIYFDMNPDFTSLYEKLEVCHHSKINTLLIPMIEISQIKSGYYYLTSVLTKLTTLKHIQFSGLPQTHRIKEKAAKAIKKGFHNFLENKGCLDILTFHNITVDKDYSDTLFEYINNTDHLTSLRFQKTNILIYGNAMKVLSNSLTNIKNLNEIRLNEAQLNEEKCKILADVLMRTKKLRIFEIHNSSNLNNGLASIVYNLSFSPNLQLLDISRTTSNLTETVVSLYKLLKINSSVQLIYANNIPNLNPSLTKQFWVSLGQCASLRVLNLSFSGTLVSKKTDLGRAIGFNAKKKGTLEYFDLTNCISGYNNIQEVYKGMCISEYDEEVTYGDPNKVAKMIASNYQKKYYNNLKALELGFNSPLEPNFNLTHFNKLLTKKDPEYVSLLSKSPKLTSLSMRNCALKKSFAQILVLALDPRRQHFCSTIRVLDLSNNAFGKQGIKALAEILPHNQIVEVLDLSKNQLGVSGASELAVALKDNKSLKFLNLFNNRIGYDGAKALAEHVLAVHPTLECLELGHNRIRNKGLKTITDALISNKDTAIKILGLRFNFIGNVGATYFFNKITSSKTKLEEVFLKNNSIDDTALNNLELIKEHQKSPVFIDMLEKLKYLDTERSERTIWIHPIQNISLQNLKKFFEITYKSGIVLDARIRRGKKYPNKPGENLFGFVEFADTNSVNRALRLAAEKLTTVDGTRFRLYKAGTGTFLFMKKTAKQKKLEMAKNSLPPVPFGIRQADLARGVRMPMRGGRGRGGRGRGRGRPMRV